MHPRSFLPLSALLAALGCREGSKSPLEPAATTQQEGPSATTALAFWQVSAGSGYYPHSCGVTNDARAYCWGNNLHGQLGVGTNTGLELCLLDPRSSDQSWPCSTRPRLVRGGYSFRHVSTGDGHTCGVTTDDRAYCWGGNYTGQLGDGTTTSRRRPVLIAGGLRIRQVAAGNYHTCALTQDNRAYCWGGNYRGQLGDGTTTGRVRPVAVAGELRFRQLSAGRLHTCGVTTTYRAYCWGDGLYGRLGVKTGGEIRNTPVRVAGGHEFREVEAGETHSCAVTTANVAFCWGQGSSGQRGNGERSSGFWPKAVAGGLLFRDVAAGSMHTCGVTTANQVYCWGYNGSGQLGDGTTEDRVTPVPVASGLAFKQVSAGHWQACGKTAASVGYCWGWNRVGSIGDGTTMNRLVPTAIVGP